ncbi:hypothetical protein BDZ89DRAFT_1131104 [Hymenopellis radicata]|nr:hypothetical protein BDZ89DRAFT_1131104 [Hymenopellis radicata]
MAPMIVGSNTANIQHAKPIVVGESEHVDDASGLSNSDPTSAPQTPALTPITSLPVLKGKDDVILVTFQPDDPNDPMNWSNAKKWRTTTLLCFMCLFIGLATASFSAGITDMCKEFGVAVEVGQSSSSRFGSYVFFGAAGPAGRRARGRCTDSRENRIWNPVAPGASLTLETMAARCLAMGFCETGGMGLRSFEDPESILTIKLPRPTQMETDPSPLASEMSLAAGQKFLNELDLESPDTPTDGGVCDVSRDGRREFGSLERIRKGNNPQDDSDDLNNGYPSALTPSRRVPPADTRGGLVFNIVVACLSPTPNSVSPRHQANEAMRITIPIPTHRKSDATLLPKTKSNDFNTPFGH